MRDDLTEIFKIMEFLIIVDIFFFHYFSSNLEVKPREISKTKSTNQLISFYLRIEQIIFSEQIA